MNAGHAGDLILPNQLTLFDRPTPQPVSSGPVEERPRFNKQCREILSRLQAGPATNNELNAMAINYRARISDLRKCGYTIRNFDRCRKTGVSWYELKE